jgi:hypothetical protein
MEARAMDGIPEETIVSHSRVRATEEAVIIWALASAQYPIDHRIIQGNATVLLIEAVSSFAINARRAIESLAGPSEINLVQPRWQWLPEKEGEVVRDLWDALNRVIHAKRLDVGWERIPSNISVISGGAIVVPYIQAETDRRALAFIDPFAMAHAFLYNALPTLNSRHTVPVQLR